MTLVYYRPDSALVVETADNSLDVTSKVELFASEDEVPRGQRRRIIAHSEGLEVVGEGLTVDEALLEMVMLMRAQLSYCFSRGMEHRHFPSPPWRYEDMPAERVKLVSDHLTEGRDSLSTELDSKVKIVTNLMPQRAGQARVLLHFEVDYEMPSSQARL